MDLAAHGNRLLTIHCELAPILPYIRILLLIFLAATLFLRKLEISMQLVAPKVPLVVLQIVFNRKRAFLQTAMEICGELFLAQTRSFFV